IYAGNTANLSMAAVFPKIIAMEREHGSLAAAFLRSLRGKKKAAREASPKPKGSIFSFTDGVETLPRRLAEQLNIQYNCKDVQVGDAPVTVITIPAHRASRLLERSHPALSSMLSRIEYAPMAIAAVSFPDFSFKSPLNGFGFLVPRNQGLHLLGALFSSALFPERAPKGRELLTCFVGGMFEPEAIQWPDDQVWEIVCPEIQSALESSEMPQPVALFRHHHAIPQYTIGHDKWVQEVKEELKKIPGL